MAKLEDDELYKMLISGNATAEDQRNAAAWITRLYTALKPFADESADIDAHYDNHRLAILYEDGSGSATGLTVAHVRAAAQTFNPE
jgi:hypothetical protein